MQLVLQNDLADVSSHGLKLPIHLLPFFVKCFLDTQACLDTVPHNFLQLCKVFRFPTDDHFYVS